MFELGKELLDRVQIGGVFRQEEEPGADRADGLADSLASMAAEIIHNDDIAGAKRWNQHRLNIKPKSFAVDRTVEDAGRIDTVRAKRRKESHCFPMTMRNLRS